MLERRRGEWIAGGSERETEGRAAHQDVSIVGLALPDGRVQGDGDKGVRLAGLGEDEEPGNGGVSDAEFLGLAVELEEAGVHLHVESASRCQDPNLRKGDDGVGAGHRAGVRLLQNGIEEPLQEGLQLQRGRGGAPPRHVKERLGAAERKRRRRKWVKG